MKMIIPLINEHIPFNIHKTKNPDFDLLPGITVFVGCNGYGKSSTIEEIVSYMRDNKMPHLYYDATVHDMDSVTDAQTLAYCFQSSEGERVSAIFSEFIGAIRKMKSKCMETKSPLILLIDGIDSGLSIDMVIEVRKLLCTITDDCLESGVIPYICIATNSYELCEAPEYFRINKYVGDRDMQRTLTAKYFRCYDPYDFTPLEFDKYEKYRNYIMETYETKAKRTAAYIEEINKLKESDKE